MFAFAIGDVVEVTESDEFIRFSDEPYTARVLEVYQDHLMVMPIKIKWNEPGFPTDAIKKFGIEVLLKSDMVKKLN